MNIISSKNDDNKYRKTYYYNKQSNRNSKKIVYSDHILKQIEELHEQRRRSLGDFKKLKRDAENEFALKNYGLDEIDIDPLLNRIEIYIDFMNNKLIENDATDVVDNKCVSCDQTKKLCNCYQLKSYFRKRYF
ncbi:PREDICTED: uncharacterized protein LOC108556374 [Nicrophorus vespilloides]|uniref:Uncharacterized protein LOC108556374 n=1 Tax=Nicrophorus vespilloides TaxID=110193 RepID=A0ABM1M043_NICVS|nr:PREDICTED: uncharacterized protein LOC108556374 [Nicrophorus vespilloides]